MERTHLDITGMSCSHCVAAVTKALASIHGATPASVHVGSADVDFDPARTSPAAIAEAVSNAGYPAKAQSPAH